MQIKRSQQQARVQAAGAGGGSGEAGGAASLSSQFGSAVGFSGQMSGISNQISMFNQQAQQGQALAGFGSNLFNAAGGFDAFKKTEEE
jgi:hypothetical protein